MQQDTTYILQYVNIIDGRTHFYYNEYGLMDDLIDFVTANHGADWTSYEVIVVRR